MCSRFGFIVKKFNTYITTMYICVVMLGLPLIVTDGYYNITQTKINCFYLLSISFICIYLIQKFFILLKRKTLLRISFRTVLFTDIAFLIFVGFTVLSAIISVYQEDVWYGEKSRYQGAVTVILYALVYFVISRNFRKTQSVLFSGILAFSVVAVLGVLNCFEVDVLGFYDSLADKYKGAYISTIGNVNFYSSYICLLFPLVICGFCQTRKKISNLIYTFVLITGSFGMMVTSSESFVLGFAASLMIIPLLIFDDSRKLKKYLLSLVVIVLSSQIFLIIYNGTDRKNIELSELMKVFTTPLFSVILVILCIVSYLGISRNSEKLLFYRKIYSIILIVTISTAVIALILSNTVGLGTLDKLFKITDSWGNYRGGIWKQCIGIYEDFSLKDKLFGIGPESLYRVAHALDVHGKRNLDQAHNEYLQYLLTVGIFGLVSYLLLIGSVTYAVIKKLRDNTLAIGLLSGLVAYWVQAAVNIAQPFTTPIMYIYISLIVAMLYNESKKTEISPSGCSL